MSVLLEGNSDARLAVDGGGHKLATVAAARHKQRMRRLFPFAALLTAACASTPAPQPVTPAAAPAAASDNHDHRSLNGMTAGELIEHFGKPRLQIVEGSGTKLQFMGPACVLDAYLYPPGNGGGTPRVTEIDARNFQGVDVSPQSCVYALEQGRRR